MGEIFLDKIIPLGRSLTEYMDMFLLDSRDLHNKKILDCGAGPSSFNYEMKKRGYRAVSIDPLYEQDKQHIRENVFSSINNMMEIAEKDKQCYRWNKIKSVDELKRMRLSTFNKFLNDYNIGKKDGRYINASLPGLPFHNKQFDIALCSHLLFLYSHQLSYQFHHDAILEMLRVAKQVRIFPLLDLNSNLSPYLDKIINLLIKKKKKIIIEAVNYEFQKGAFRQLVIS